MNVMIEKNLAALERTNPATAERLRQTPPAENLTFTASREGDALSASLEVEPTEPNARPRKVTLASQFRPRTEADRLAEQVDVSEHGLIIMIGFGVGHHVRAVSERIAGKAALAVYEPNPAVLRAVLERIDMTDLLGGRGFVLLCGEVDQAAITQAIEPLAPMLAEGVQLLTHPPTRQLEAERVRLFSETLVNVTAYCRTNVATAMINAEVTVTNLTSNLGWYAAGQTLDALKDAAAGRLAVLVAAGPSLAKNVHLLRDPAVRERVVVIAVQTVLKPLLDRGIRPDLVTAVDYHEISRRFYEDLPPLPDVTLVADPKANPVIFNHYPGPIRVLRHDLLDRVLGDDARPRDGLPGASTVAHLSFYLAQYLGCDPIAMIGQDLGFSDGLYYFPGTAIHDVWASELSPFNTVEMMEWKRVARLKTQLRKREDIHGRPIYSDEQMLTYFGQFERDFARAEQHIIDATEGGLPKRHTEILSLETALSRHAVGDAIALPSCEAALDPAGLALAVRHLRQRREQVRELRDTIQQTRQLLERMLADQRRRDRMEKHFTALERHQRRVKELDEAFRLITSLNQVGVYNRLRADRAIDVARAEMDSFERQRRQLERDKANLDWLEQSCERALRLLAEGAEQVGEQAKRVSEETTHREAAAAHAGAATQGGVA